MTSATIVQGSYTPPAKTFSYNATGNIVTKTDHGVYSYPTQGSGSVRPNAVSSVVTASGTKYYSGACPPAGEAGPGGRQRQYDFGRRADHDLDAVQHAAHHRARRQHTRLYWSLPSGRRSRTGGTPSANASNRWRPTAPPITSTTPPPG